MAVTMENALSTCQSLAHKKRTRLLSGWPCARTCKSNSATGKPKKKIIQREAVDLCGDML